MREGKLPLHDAKCDICGTQPAVIYDTKTIHVRGLTSVSSITRLSARTSTPDTATSSLRQTMAERYVVILVHSTPQILDADSNVFRIEWSNGTIFASLERAEEALARWKSFYAGTAPSEVMSRITIHKLPEETNNV